jgi:hypothetical protein
MSPWISWLPVIIQIAIAVLVVIANKKIRFAPNEEVATEELKQLAFRVMPWILNLIAFGIIVYSLFSNIFSNEPLTRATIFSIAFSVGNLLFLVTMLSITYIYARINARINLLYSSIRSILYKISTLAGTINKLSDSLMVVSDNVTLKVKASEPRLVQDKLKSLLPDSGKTPQ